MHAVRTPGPPLGYAHPPIRTYLDLVDKHQAHHVELCEDQDVSIDIDKYRCVRLDRATFRCALLYVFPGGPHGMVSGCDGDRDTVRLYLMAHGVPALRIGGPIPKPQ